MYDHERKINVFHETFSICYQEIKYFYLDIIKPRFNLELIVDVQQFLNNQLCVHLGVRVPDYIDVYNIRDYLATDVITEFKKRIHIFTMGLQSLIDATIVGKCLVEYTISNDTLLIHTVHYTYGKF